ncbi:hypothetical protein DER46DRAFT_689065 [Fusarium sp. MPI-SDFR-AT-0072]|nr:hypothetical protein DER46DRAFT_689065 [Fusarium sp. MPI-SDFR-AT-0072]
MGIQRRLMSYYPAHDSMGGLAALIYTTLAYHWPSRDQYHSQPKRLEAIRQRYLIQGYYTPFGELIELKAFAKSIVRREGMPGNLSWAPDGRSFVVGNDKEVKLSDFCKTYHNAIALVKEQVEEMMLGLKPGFNIDVVRDDLNCRKAGWSFLQKPENKLSDAWEMLIDKLRTSQFRGKPTVRSRGGNMTGYNKTGPCTMTVLSVPPVLPPAPQGSLLSLKEAFYLTPLWSLSLANHNIRYRQGFPLLLKMGRAIRM